MPIYEYRCDSCGKELEKIQKISDAALTDCPECGEAALVKLVSASSFRLKGSGWYETDFKTGNKKNGVSDTKAKSSDSSTENKKDSSKDSSKANNSATKDSSGTKKKSANKAATSTK